MTSRCARCALALPAASMHTKLPNLTDLPHDLKIVRTYDRIQRAFPGSQTPAQVVVKALADCGVRDAVVYPGAKCIELLKV